MDCTEQDLKLPKDRDTGQRIVSAEKQTTRRLSGFRTLVFSPDRCI